MNHDCNACNHTNPIKRTFDARYYNPDKSRPKLRQFGMNERNMTSDQLVKLGLRAPEIERNIRKIGGPSPYERRKSR